MVAVVPSSLRPSSVLLLLLVGRHYAYTLAEPALRGILSKAIGGLVILILLWWVVINLQSWLATLIAVWWSVEEAQVIGCSVGYLVRPWKIEPGQGLCSAWTGFDVGSITIGIVALLALFIAITHEDS